MRGHRLSTRISASDEPPIASAVTLVLPATPSQRSPTPGAAALSADGKSEELGNLAQHHGQRDPFM
jgi:hypothetical protein